MSSSTIANSQAGQLLVEALCQLVADRLRLADTNEIQKSIEISTPFSTISQADWVEAVRLWNQYGRPLLDELPARDCPACGSANESRKIFESYDGYAFHECNNCSCWFVPLLVDQQLFEEFFAGCPEALEIASRSFSKRRTEEKYQADLMRFDEYFETIQPLLHKNETIRYLDIGCSLGNSLISATRFGMHAFGVETAAECLRIAPEANLSIHDSLELFPPRSFNIISFWESLEHIGDPFGMLACCDRVLSENGLVVFSTPNLNSPLLRLQRADCSVVHGGYDSPGHINLFAPQHLQQLFDRAGFELLYLDGQYSLNPFEFFSYMVGKQRGATSILTGEFVSVDFSEQTHTLINRIGPILSLLERLILAAPILFGIACRKSDKANFSNQLTILKENRKKQILSKIAEIYSDFDDNAMTKIQHLQAEINKLDEMLTESQKRLADMHNYLQAEVNKRDQMLTESQKRLVDMHNYLQAEVNKRDQMLAELQLQLNKGR